MSPAFKSKSKDKSSAKTVKEQPKVMIKPSPSRANGGSVPASSYNPTSGTFHSLESVPPLLPASQGNIWFPSMDEIDEQSRSSFDTAADYDSVSNNGSGSGESDDLKDKVTSSSTSRPETIPGCDTEKRDKIRQKNEKKHQRQRERRAQELHEKCCSYLMTRKLESLSQKLVVMGFPSEQATMALILNEGRVEDSVSWLLGSEGKQIDPTSIDSGCNLKIDILEELARISDMELKFKCSKQEVERVIVSCEGDFEKAAEAIQTHRLVKSAVAAAPKLDDSSNHVIVNGANKASSSVQNPITRMPGKPAAAANIQQPKDDKEGNHSRTVLTGVSLPDNGSGNLRHLKGRTPPMDWTKPQAAPQVDHRWTTTSPIPFVSHPIASPLQPGTISPKAEAHYALGLSEMKKPGALREPIIMMQRPQSISLQQNLASASANISSSLTSQPINAGWYSNRVSNIDILRNLEQNLGRIDLNSGNYNLNQPFYQHSHHQPSVMNLMDKASAIWSNGSSNSGWGSLESNLYGSLSAGGWASNAGSIPQFDYTSIDWSHDISPYRKNSMASSNTGRLHETWSTAFMEARPTYGYNDIGVAGLEEGGMTLNTRLSSVRSNEWTSPFAGNDLFGISRQSVTSPTLQGRGF